MSQPWLATSAVAELLLFYYDLDSLKSDLDLQTWSRQWQRYVFVNVMLFTKKNNFPDILKQDKCYSARQLYLCVTCRKPAHQLLVPKLSSGRTNTQRPTARPGPLKWSVKRNPRDVLTQRQSNTVN